MVQRRNGRYHVETGRLERVHHYIPMHEFDGRRRTTVRSRSRQSIVIDVHCEHFRALLGELAREQALPASHVKGPLTVNGYSTQYEVMVMNVVIPFAHWSFIIASLRMRTQQSTLK